MGPSDCLNSTWINAGISPFPYRTLDGREPAPGKRFKVEVPAAGVETVAKMLDKNGARSNEMLGYKASESASYDNLFSGCGRIHVRLRM